MLPVILSLTGEAAVMTALPRETAVIVPFPSTETTLLSELLHRTSGQQRPSGWTTAERVTDNGPVPEERFSMAVPLTVMLSG